MTRAEALKLLEVLFATYPNQAAKIKDPSATADAWVINLGDLDAGDVYKAARLHMSTSKYFPNPADIREKVIKARIIYATEPKAIEAPKATVTDLKQKEKDDYYLEELCKFVGLGYEEDDDADLLGDFLPYEK